MLDLVKTTIDKDLVALDELVGDCSLPQRDWQSLIDVYNQNNNKFPIPAPICAKIIQEIKEGVKPSSVFKAEGLSYTNFINRYNKNIAVIEELSSRPQLTDFEWETIRLLRIDPFFILGQDIERVRAFRFNQLQKDLKDLSMSKPETFLNYMKEFHSEEFTNKEDKQSVEVVIQFGSGLLEAI